MGEGISAAMGAAVDDAVAVVGTGVVAGVSGVGDEPPVK